MNTELTIYKTELQQELSNILSYWHTHAIDLENGGFAGKIDNDNKADLKAQKGSVLHSRILWTFSAAYQLTKTAQHLQMAERAFKYLTNYFVDKDFGGVYWTVDYRGKPLDVKKQIYAQAFAIYGLSEYFMAMKDEAAKRLALNLYKAVIDHSYDKVNGGYVEAFSKDWGQTGDLRLSGKDANERKSMNTHLHLLEAFANLYRIWPDAALKQKITELIDLFLKKIIDPQTNHLLLFFDDRWNSKGSLQSFGHDIEAAWLIQEAAEIIGEKDMVKKVQQISIAVAQASLEGLDRDGAMWYEYDPLSDSLVKEKHWWVQAEAMVGFFNAWQITGDDSYLKKSIGTWSFVKLCLLDKKNGEWFWGITDTYSMMPGEDKVGIWKCPYHNSRACMEIIKRIK